MTTKRFLRSLREPCDVDTVNMRRDLKLSFRVKCSVATCALSGVLGGLSLSSFSGLLELPAFANNFTFLTTSDKSSLSASLLFGAFVCTVVAGPLVDSKGKRFALSISALLFTAGSAVVACATAKWHLALGRVLSGCGYAIANIGAPAYLTESAPNAYRAIFVNIYQSMINLGIVSAQIANALSVSSSGWRSVAAIPVAPALIMLFLALTTFENEPAHESATPSENGGVRASIALIRADESSSRRLSVAAGLMAGQQLTGVNAIIFYAPLLVMKMGLGSSQNAVSAPFWAAALVGGANCIASMFAMVCVDNSGRRGLFTKGGAIICGALCLLGFVRWNGGPSVLGVISLVLFICAFAVSWGPLPFLVSAEVLPREWRGFGLTIAGLTSHASSSLVVLGFLLLEKGIGAHVYALFALVMVSVTLSVVKWLPETKDRTLQEIDAMFKRSRSVPECV